MESLFGIIVEAWNPWSNTKALWPSTKVRSHRLLILDGLRMVAIVWHVSGEAWTSTFWPRQADRVEFLGTAQYVLNADLSYDILLLVSGVAITSSVLAEIEPTGVFDFKRFIFRRWCGIWPALAAGLLVTVLLDKNSSNHCRDEWPFVLLLANNYFGDLQCMPQTWLIAVLFQLYVLTPVLMFACVNYERRMLRQHMSGYVLLAFLSSVVPVFIAWLFYETFGDDFVYSPTGWPPGPFFKSVFLRWAPYLIGMSIALMKWDTSIPLEAEKMDKEAQNMPFREEVEERMPITCHDATRGLLDILADLLCLMVVLWITFVGTQQSLAFLSLILRITYAWTLARLVYRLLDGAYAGIGAVLSMPLFYLVSQLAYCAFVLEGIVYIDIRAMLSVFEAPATEPLVQSIGLYLLAWLLFLASSSAAGYAMYLAVRGPFRRFIQREGDCGATGNGGQPGTGGEIKPKPLQRKSRSGMNGSASIGTLQSQSVQAVHDTAISVASGSHTSLQTFQDSFVPNKEVRYFSAEQPCPGHPDGYWILSVVTAYNEGGEEMAETLITLHDQIKNLPVGRKLHVLLAFDGWSKMSPTMRRYLARLYPGSEAEQAMRLENHQNQGGYHTPSWFSEIDGTPNAPWYSEALPVTFTLQQRGRAGELAEVDIAPGRSMYVSTLIKFDNRRKHNSHEWFLRAFGKQYDSKFMYLTDVGTTADQFCIPRLARYMDINQEYVAVTGFQRAQRLKRGASLVQHIQREVQAYELGPANCGNVKASQGLLGFQLILSGPCQMVRSEDALQDKFLDSFFGMINKDPEIAGVLHANLQLTEDMAFGCYLYSQTPNKKTGYVPDAYFNYDVETAPDRFLKQRRRWFNGIVGGINGEINPFSAIWWKASPKPLHLKLRNFLVMCQQYVLVMQFLVLPSVYMFNIFQGLGGFYMSDYINAPQNHPLYPIYFDYIQPLDGTLPYLGVGLYFAILSFWVFSHRKREYIPWLYHVMLVVNLIIGVLTAAFIFSFFAEIQNLHGSTVAGFTTTLYFFALASPMLSSLVMADSYGLAVSVINIPFMMAFLPMWILIGAYGLARFVDFTWGNRPHESESLDGARRDAYMKKTERLGLLIIFMYLGGNLLIATILIALSHVWKGNTLVIYLVLFGPYGLSAIGGLIFNTWYAVRYRWAETLANAFKLRPRVAGDVPCNRS